MVGCMKWLDLIIVIIRVISTKNNLKIFSKRLVYVKSFSYVSTVIREITIKTPKNEKVQSSNPW